MIVNVSHMSECRYANAFANIERENATRTEMNIGYFQTATCASDFQRQRFERKNTSHLLDKTRCKISRSEKTLKKLTPLHRTDKAVNLKTSPCVLKLSRNELVQETVTH